MICDVKQDWTEMLVADEGMVNVRYEPYDGSSQIPYRFKYNLSILKQLHTTACIKRGNAAQALVILPYKKAVPTEWIALSGDSDSDLWEKMT